MLDSSRDAAELGDVIPAQIRCAISDAYYDARNEGGTMEQAADKAADRVCRILEVNGIARRSTTTQRSDQ